MKIIICGKGGSGKSTITSLLARQNAASGRRTIVVDTDVSNVGIHRILGTDKTRDLIGYFGDRKSVNEKIHAAKVPGETETAALGNWDFDSIPKEFSSIKDGVQLVTVGKINEASEGCKCSISSIARQFIMGLQLGGDDLVIVDTEAGVEHFGRGFDSLCDIILMVVDPTFESLSLVEKVTGMADSISVPLYYVLNKTDANTSAALRNKISDSYRIIGEFPLDTGLLAAGLGGQAMPMQYRPAAEILASVGEKLAVC
ncbi:MAG: P-loop NTPase [Opitutales bacterium]|jgi:CO dehydrogenase maturation factor